MEGWSSPWEQGLGRRNSEGGLRILRIRVVLLNIYMILMTVWITALAGVFAPGGVVASAGEMVLGLIYVHMSFFFFLSK